MANILRIQRRMEVAAAEQDASSDARQAVAAIDKSAAELEQLQQLLVILGVRMQVDLLRAELDTQLNAQTPAPPFACSSERSSTVRRNCKLST